MKKRRLNNILKRIKRIRDCGRNLKEDSIAVKHEARCRINVIIHDAEKIIRAIQRGDNYSCKCKQHKV